MNAQATAVGLFIIENWNSKYFILYGKQYKLTVNVSIC